MSEAALVDELRDPASNGVTFPDDARAAEYEASGRQLGFDVRRIAVGNSKARMLEAIARTLQFPPHFGHNWDALADCLGDLSWLPAKGYLLVLDTGNDWSTKTRDDLEMLVDICGEVADDWAERGVPFHVVVMIPPEGGPW